MGETRPRAGQLTSQGPLDPLQTPRLGRNEARLPRIAYLCSGLASKSAARMRKRFLIRQRGKLADVLYGIKTPQRLQKRANLIFLEDIPGQPPEFLL